MTLPTPRPIIVLGCPRSGTTLLQQMLHCHRRIALPSETRLVQPAYRHRLEFGDLAEPANRRAFASWLVGRDEAKFRALAPLDRDETAEAIVAAPPTIGSALATVFSRYAEAHGRARWGDKRPGYFRQVPMLLRLFPDAQFVHLVRDGRDAVASLRSMPWYGGDVFSAALTWREAIDAGARNAARLGPDTFHQMRYEDLTADPEAALRGLCAFLGEEYDPAMAEPRHHARRTVPAKRAWHLRTHQDVDTRRVGAWADRLAEWEAGLVEHVAGDRLADWGYAPAGLPRPDARHLARFRAVELRRWRVQRGQAVMDRARRLREPNPVESLAPAPA
ncbi:sulfotransferase family protein [Actinomadura atramentaria]|uniref:sulfotransferase family protein n=1 Tax=Actinomadura atramentaria TaxID=1990 RepID=UPI000376177F|nr:sulfotransferase [Actinomadura atramentaria]